ncbi:MAG: hypothetical protein L0G94_07180 [Brachybacterium sp.]|uniref:hypothetical protein n=1 Tax=Brachybacterium sp. TaxID=1891286 RepID=UPI0026492684|nr:hypothetical protein [Brachybacterium sp.]MDN5686453.1 hypothetical protein [Brachybacterium sp.]
MSLDDITKLLVPLGGAVAWVILLWLRRSDRREDAMKDIMERRVEEAREERDKALADARHERSVAARERRYKLAYWRQLVEAGIDPHPPLDGGEDQ